MLLRSWQRLLDRIRKATPNELLILFLVALLALYGRRLPLAAMAALGPLGVVGIAFALGTTDTPGDGAILYTWPVLWEAYFFGRRGTVLVIA